MLSLTRQQVLDRLDVSRETSAKLDLYADLLIKWQTRINLVAPNTLGDLWHRHILDSAQLHRLLPPNPLLVDLGSGAGFPGLVLGILGVRELHLVESDARKIAFLREVARLTDTPVTLHNKRIETIGPLAADVVTARALAPLPLLLRYAAPLLGDRGIGLFLKGENAAAELAEAERDWQMRTELLPSLTHQDARILRVEQIRHVE